MSRRRFKPGVAARQLRHVEAEVARLGGLSGPDPSRAVAYAARAAHLIGQLREHKACRDCGRPLFHPESVKLGIGPDCAAKRDAS